MRASPCRGRTCPTAFVTGVPRAVKPFMTAIHHRMAVVKPPLAKDIAPFAFTGTAINEAGVRDLSTGGFFFNATGLLR